MSYYIYVYAKITFVVNSDKNRICMIDFKKI
jgi:hypothetical protein